jgi:apolipoprotein N-acyltransferase
MTHPAPGKIDRMVMSLLGWRRLAVATGIGAVGAFGLAPYGFWPATLISLAAAFSLHRTATNPRTAAATGWCFATGYFAVALFWIVEPFLVDVARHGWMAPFALVFMAGGLALFWGAAFWAAFRLGRNAGIRTAALVLTLCITEVARAYIFTGFPWAGISQLWVGQGGDLSLAWIGPHGLTLVTLIAVALFSTTLAQTVAGVRLLGRVGPLLAFAGAGPLALTLAPEIDQTGPVIRLVQPNAPQDQKWDPDFIPIFFDRQIGYTAAGPRPDLIVWPETSVPTLMQYATPAFEAISEAAGGTPVVLGIQRFDERRLYNSLVVLGPDGAPQMQYDKHHLVPFGEYIPFGDLAARFGLSGFAAQNGNGFSAGPGPRVLDFGMVGQGLPLICYEAVFPQHVRSTGARPDFLMQITNDAWFGGLSGPYQHLAQARMRAIEQGLPMIRVANTGVSAMIDPYGRITGQLPLGTAGYLDVNLPAPLAKTLYAHTADWPVFGLVLLLLATLITLQPRLARPN